MSRSNPSVNATNPAVRWFEWNGEFGILRYYDKERKETIAVGLPFTFLLLDQLATVGGWNEDSQSGIYANEVRDTRTDLLVVKSFKGGIQAEGLYKDIRDRVGSVGGYFVANLYIAAKIDGALEIASLKLKGAALGAWMEWSKANRGKLYDHAVKIASSTTGKHGRVVYHMPVFEAQDVSPETQAAAVALDKTLQAFLADYFARTTIQRVDQPAPPQHVVDDLDEPPVPLREYDAAPLTDEEIPF